MNIVKYQHSAPVTCFTGFKSWHNAISRFCFCLFMLSAASGAYANPSQMPLSLTTSGQPNLLVILDNSNSMDEDPNGIAQGSNCPASKSETARSVIKNMISNYSNEINMGLMTYKLAATSSWYIHNSEYDVSYGQNSSYNSAFDLSVTGHRAAAATKRYRIPNPSSNSKDDYIYFNIASPFYFSSNQGTAFCYSPTANASVNVSHPDGFNNGENPTISTAYPYGSGPWDWYRCFSTKTGSSDTLPTSPASSGWPQWPPDLTSSSSISVDITKSERDKKYSNYLYINYFFPTDSDLAQGITDFGNQIAWSFVGSAYYAATSPGRGHLEVPISPLNTAQGNTISSLLACNVPQANRAVCQQNAACTANGIKNAGITPIEGTLLTAKDYFGGSWSNASEGYTGSTYPLPQSCNKNFVILITDGLPDTDKNGNIVTSPSTAITAAAAAASSLKSSGVKTYVVGFGLNATPLNAIATAGGTGTAYSAFDFDTLSSALDAILKDILSPSNSSAAVAANSAQLNTGTQIYQARYDATNWSGQLSAFSVNTSTGAIITPALWESSLPASDARNIWTYKPTASAGSRGVLFLWDNLINSQQDYLNTNDLGRRRVGWLRGDHRHEQAQDGSFRDRTDNVLGDIINSNPVYVGGSQDYGYGTLPDAAGGHRYTDFLTSKAGRTPMLYAGANDGMLHGFAAGTGREVFAYIPNALYPKLSQLTSPNYQHQYYVDGVSGVSDVYDGTNWHTVLAGATGAGGKAVFALDVTNPTAFGAGSALWEFTNANDADLGYTLAQPAVVRLQNGSWVVIVANGYNSDNGHAVLFVFNALTGEVLKIDTGVGAPSTPNNPDDPPPNGLSSPVAVDTDNDRSVDTVYAGDLYGNLWKFDLSCSDCSAGSWPVPSSPLFVASDADGVPQPITAKPNVGPVGAIGTDQNGVGIMVYFGTGKYFELGDNTVGLNPQVQSFYGLWDNGTAITRANLQEQTITDEGTATTIGGAAITNPVVVVSKNTVCYAATSTGCTTSSALKKGWALNLTAPANVAQGERVIGFPLVRQGFVLFTTLIPTSVACSYGGSSHFMAVSALTGGESSVAPFDSNGDGMVNINDKVVINGVAHFASGMDLMIGIINTPAVIEASIMGFGIFSGSIDGGSGGGGSGGGGLGSKGLFTGAITHRSWRQLK